ncbi:MAG: hypothetical protein D6791_09510, partial [Chloroflexi bacterium]
KTLNPQVCKGTGWEWNFIYKGTGVLTRADDETVRDNAHHFCSPNDHIVGGRIKSAKTYTYKFDANLGIFRPGAHPCWEGAKHMTPTDEDHDGDIDKQDLQKFIASFRNASGQWLTDLSQYHSGDVFRFFADTNGNNCNDTAVDTQAPIRKKFDNMQNIFWTPQNLAFLAANAKIPGTANDYTDAILVMPNSFVAADCSFGCIGPGQGQLGGRLVWTRVTGPSSTFAHEVGHNIGKLLDRYWASYDPQPDDMVTKEGATAVYINRQKLPANQVFAVMGYEVPGNRAVHYRDDYKTLFDKLKVTGTAQALRTDQDAYHFVVSGRVLADGSVSDLSFQRLAGLEPTPADPASPYRLVFGRGDTVLQTYPFPVGINAPPPEGYNAWPEAEQLFYVVAPYPDGTEWVALLHDQDALALFEPSAHAPAVQLLTPNGGEHFAGDDVVQISWTASDLDGDDLLTTVYYSPDAGTTWHVIAANVKGGSLAWPLADMPGTTGGGLLRVVASDGFRQGEDVSDAPFTVENKPPVVAIQSPAAGEQVLQCGAVYLEGTALDPEGQMDHLLWYVDGEAQGEGAVLTLEDGLFPGEHVIELRAQDRQGAQAVAEASLTVLADSDCDGMSNAFEEQYAFDPDAPADAALDADGDGLSNADEYWYGLDPTDPDSDHDGYPDGEEINRGSDPSNPNSIPSLRAYMPLIVRP